MGKLEGLANLGYYGSFVGAAMTRVGEIYGKATSNLDFPGLREQYELIIGEGAKLNHYLDTAGKDMIILAGAAALVSIIGRIYHKNKKI